MNFIDLAALGYTYHVAPDIRNGGVLIEAKLDGIGVRRIFTQEELVTVRFKDGLEDYVCEWVIKSIDEEKLKRKGDVKK